MVTTLERTTTFPSVPEDTIVSGLVETPMGAFGAVITSRGLACLSFPEDSRDACEAWVARHAPKAQVISDHPALTEIARQLTAYLDGSLHEFSIPLDLRGTEFQVEVWQALQEIPYGEVRSYGAVAGVIGRPRAVRAVGMANHNNPVPVIVPCHRVIGSNRSLTGYGGGLDLKERLLRLEGVLLG